MKHGMLVTIAAVTVALVAAAAGSGLVVASAADVGGLGGGLFSASAALAWPTSDRQVSALTAHVPVTTVTSLDFTVTGTSLGQLDGQHAVIALFDDTGALAFSLDVPLVLNDTLVIAGNTATVTTPVSAGPVVSPLWTWSIAISGPQVLLADSEAPPALCTGGGNLLVAP